MIDVIDRETAVHYYAKDYSVHSYLRLSLIQRSRTDSFSIPAGIEIMQPGIPTSIPLPLHKPVKVLGINLCELTLRERYETIVYGWGCHLVALHGHEV